MAAETCEESLEVMHMNEWLKRKELPLWCANTSGLQVCRGKGR